jgi:SAM-dependent methyltransferase
MAGVGTEKMINIEGRAIRADRRWNLRRLARPWLRSEVLWRASGLTYATSVIATTGSYGTREQYLASMAARMKQLRQWFHPTDRVFEFGSGLGGNLIAVAPEIRLGYGVDINPLFVRRANRLANLAGARNVEFVAYDGVSIPYRYPVDVVLSIGVFERLPKPLVRSYLKQFRRLMPGGGTLLLYFLTVEAIRSGFGRVLGGDAYVPWERSEILDALATAGFGVTEVLGHFPSEGDTFVLRCTPVAEGGPGKALIPAGSGT